MRTRILIVGLGSIGKRHLRIVREQIPKADIRVLRHRPCQEVPEFADGCYDSLLEACKFFPQAAIIANPATFHLEIAGELVKNGCHLLIEKPLSVSLAGVEQLANEMMLKKLVLQVGYNLRFLPSLVYFKSLIHENMIGRILSVHSVIGQYLPSWRPGTDYRDGVSAQRDLGGGVLLELSHELDYLLWIFGEVNLVSAWLGRQSMLEIDVEDTACLVMEFLPDTNGRLLMASVNMDFVRHDTTRLCTVIGENGSLQWNGISGEVKQYDIYRERWRHLEHFPPQRDVSF